MSIFIDHHETGNNRVILKNKIRGIINCLDSMYIVDDLEKQSMFHLNNKIEVKGMTVDSGENTLLFHYNIIESQSGGVSGLIIGNIKIYFEDNTWNTIVK